MKNRSKTIRIKNELPELLEAVCNHPDCKDWLRDAIWDAFNDQPLSVIFSADYWRGCIESITKARQSESKDHVPYQLEDPNESHKLN